MKIKEMKSIDHYVGLPICFCLSIIERLSRLIMYRSVSEIKTPVRNVVISKYFGLGSLLLATPMIRAVKNKFPSARIIFITFAENKDVLLLIKDVDEIKTLRKENILHFSVDLFRTLFYLWKIRVDIFFDLEFFSKFSTIVTYLSGAKARVGYYMRHMWRGELLTHHVYYNYYKHISEIFLSLAQALGADTDDLQIVDLRGSPLLKEANAKISEYGIQEGKSIIINVNASELCLERRWPAKNFISLISKVAKEYPEVKFVFIGSATETVYVNYIVQELSRLSIKNVINLSGKLQVWELCSILSRSLLFIGNDSGPLHLSSAMRLPTISFFGPETPVLYGPRFGNNLVFSKGLYCSPCLNVYNAKTSNCAGKNRCMEAIDVEEVIVATREKIRELLRNQIT